MTPGDENALEFVFVRFSFSCH